MESKHIAKKQFGQNFLKDMFYKQQIIQAIPVELLHGANALKLIEIGVGLGDLSRELLGISPSLLTYEIDSALCSLIHREFEEDIASGRFTLVNTDVLKMHSKQKWLHKSPYMLVSNLPYYIATHIILKALRDDSCKYMIVMTQKEVAEKFCASVGDREFCALSVLANTFGVPKLLFDVPPSAFTPMPKVTSAVFCIDKSKGDSISSTNIESFENMLKTAFSAPRKKCLSNLKAKYLNAIDIFTILDIDPNSRPHQIDTQTYHLIFQSLKELK